jgi:DNA integrity scanning protein DisA with diadenylate cyclase activity
MIAEMIIIQKKRRKGMTSPQESLDEMTRELGKMTKKLDKQTKTLEQYNKRLNKLLRRQEHLDNGQ